MKKYKLINTDLMLDGKLIPEGSEVTLSDKDAEQLSEYLSPLSLDKDTQAQKENSNKKRSKQ